MSQRQHASIFHFHIILIIALLVTADADTRAFAQADQNPAGGNASRPSASTGQPAKEPAAAPAPSDSTPDPKPKTEGIPAMVVDGEHVQGILGKQVRSSTGEDMGRIVDVIVDRSARVRAAVIDFGGFLGVGNRQIAVAWSAIRFPNEGRLDPLIVDFTRDQLRVAPAYKPGEQSVLLGSPDNPNPSSVGVAPDKAPPPKDSPAK